MTLKTWFAMIVACAPVISVQAREADASILRTAFFESEERGPSVAYISDAFRAAPQDDLLIITYTRPVAAWHFNSPREVVNGVHRWLRANSSFDHSHMVAIVSEKSVIRIFITPPKGLELDAFAYPRAQIAPATADDVASLVAIGSEDFAAYAVEKLAERQRTGNQLFGKDALKIMPVELRVVIRGTNTAALKGLRRSLKRVRFAETYHPEFRIDGERLFVTTTFDFDRDKNKPKALQFFDSACDAAIETDSVCVDWSSRTRSQTIDLRR